MTVKRINPPALCQPTEDAYAQMARSTGAVSYRISGQVAVDVDGTDLFTGNMEGQTRACYEAVGRALSHVNLGRKDVTHLLTFTTDLDANSAIESRVVSDYFGEFPPAATVVEVPRPFSRIWLIEVQADAVGDL